MTSAADMVQQYTKAEQMLLEGREVWWGNRRLSMESLAEIRRGRQEWERRLNAQRRGRGPSVATFPGCGDG